MIEFLLIFALGFLAAAILAMLITPTIYGRVVKLTEKRIEATVPLSLAEIKGKADQMRAGFASESAKLSTQLRHAQDQLAQSNVRSDKLQSDLATLAGDKQLADQKIEELVNHAGEMRSDTRKKEQLIDKLSETVREFERMKKMDNSEIARLHNDLITISTEVESMRIDLAASHTETVNLRSQIDQVSIERDQLLNDIQTIADAAQTMEQNLQQEQENHNQARIDLAAVQTSLADRDAQLQETLDLLELQKQQLDGEIRTLEGQLSVAADAANEQDRVLHQERQEHETTRIELAAAQSTIADRDSQLIQADDAMRDQARDFGKRIEVQNKEKSRLESDLATAHDKSDSLQNDLQQEKKSHKETRIELSAGQSLLNDRNRQLAETNELVERHVQELREASEANRVSLQELRKAQRRIDALEGRVENTKAALEKSKSMERQAREKISELKSEARDLHKTFKAVTSQADELERRLGLEQEQSTRIAESLKTKEQELASRGKQLEEALGNASRRESQLELVRAEQQDKDRAREHAEKRELELIDQINLLKTELKQSHATSRQFKEQLNKMRKDVKQLHKGAEVGGNGAAMSAQEIHPKNGEAVERNGAVNGRVENLKQRHAELIDKIKEASDPNADSGVREEIAEIAAAVVGISGQREGEASPIHRIISDAPASANAPSGRVSLASRAKSELEN
ncbi:hypothetical protein [Hoeflea poritis]|uniref:Chromosome segregation protein n=1 Tax=Hoeflea poritis TaxID=2993659 RepID=A0ABT4VT43_9HYPH|nr:hypothetical protein [Hoeflea poritis]MDA4847880.1 hypothetical protein [Hoeflea poritis]